MMSPQQWWFLMSQLAEHGQNQVFANTAGAEPTPFGGGTPSTPAPYENIPGKSSSTTSSTGVGPTNTPSDPNTGFPPAQTGSTPTTAPDLPSFQGPGSDPTFNPDVTPTPGPGAFPTELPSPAGWGDPTVITPTDTGFSDIGSIYGAPSVSEFPGSMPSELPTPTAPSFFNPPTQEGMLPTETGYIQPDFSNPPTSEGILPADSQQYIPPDSSNPPTNEAMTPTDPQQYLQSTAGANIPTDETMLPTDPQQYQTATPEPTPEATTYYPAGDGTYVALDANGNPVGTPTPSESAPEAAAPSTPQFGTDPNINPFVGGAFLSPPGGSIGGPLGTGSAGNMPFYGRFNLNQVLKTGRTQGRDPEDALSQFAAFGRFNPSAASALGAPIVNRDMLRGREDSQKPGGGVGLAAGGGPGGIA